MTLALGIVLFVIAQRLAELVIAKRNTARLLAEGAVEHSPGHYPVIVLLHTAWLAALLWLALQNPPVHPVLIAVFAVLQAGRVWILATMGRFWTTRIISLPGAPLVRTGPFRLCRHPNYLVVFLEIIVLPLAFGEPLLAALFGAANAAILYWRIRAEDGVLAGRRAGTEPSVE